MTAIALGISVVLNAALAIRCLIWKKGADGLVIYMKKKGYTPPTKEETAECIRESFTSRSEI